MLSNNQIKYFSSLRDKKYREMHSRFLAEGEKIVKDFLRYSICNIKVESLLANSEFLRQNKIEKSYPDFEIIEVSDADLKRISSLSTPNKAILVCIKPGFVPDFDKISKKISVYLEDIRDPGNLGTIIRSADWFGITDIFCSKESVDVFNPKVIQSSMGSICRVRIYYYDANEVIAGLKRAGEIKVFGTLLDGRNIYTEILPSNGLIVMGNESRGISRELKVKLDIKLTIPSSGESSFGTNSLNIASAAAVTFSEFSRKNYSK